MDRKIAILLFVSLVAMGCYDSFETYIPSLVEDSTPNSTIEALHEIYAVGVREISEDIIVRGTVSANDSYGNFFKSFMLESEGYALELLGGLYDSYVRYPIGSSICLNLNGLAMDRYRGVLRVGLATDATSSYSLDYLGCDVLLDKHLTLISFGDPLEATPMAISSLSEDQAGRLISIKGLLHHSDSQEQSSWAGYALFRDAALDSIWCYTSTYADFGSLIIPQQEVELCGILQYGSTDSETNQFIIKMRGEDDCIY